MAKKKSSVVNLATRKKAAEPAAEIVEEVVEDKVQTAKETVDELLKDVPMEIKSGELLELDETPEGDPNDVEWLTEQLATIGEENDKLRKEAAEAKKNYKKLYEEHQKVNGGATPGDIANPQLVPDSEIKRGAISLLEEFQSEYLRHPTHTRAHTKISLVALIQKMLGALPFLDEYRRV